MECLEIDSLKDTTPLPAEDTHSEKKADCDNTNNEQSKSCPDSDSKNYSDDPTESKDLFCNTVNSNSIAIKNEAVMETEDNSNKPKLDSDNGYSDIAKVGSLAEVNVTQSDENIPLECEPGSNGKEIEAGMITSPEKDLEPIEAELEIEAENEGEISDGNFSDEAVEASDEGNEIIQDEGLKSKNMSPQSENKCKDSLSQEDGELSDLVNDDIEEGEVEDDTTGMVTCRFFARGNCMYGSSCHFMHVTDKGLYKMFDSVDVNINVRAMAPFNPKPELAVRPPPQMEPEIAFRELAWERGLKLAKEQRKLALEKKSDPEFEEKNLYMNINDNIQSPNNRVRNPLLERQVIKKSTNDYYINARKGDDYEDQFQKARGVSYKTNQYYVKASSPQKLKRNYEEGAKAKRASDKMQWKDPWRRSKSPVSRRRSRSPLSVSDSCSSSLCSSHSSCHSKEDYRRKKHTVEKHHSMKGHHKHRSKHSISPKGVSRKSPFHSSTSRSSSSSSEERLKFRKEVYSNSKTVPSFRSNSRRSKYRDKSSSKEKSMKTYAKNNYESPVPKPYPEKRSIRVRSPKRTSEKSRRSSSLSSYQSYKSISRSCSSVSLRSRSRSNSPVSCSSHYSVKSSYSSKSFKNQISTKPKVESHNDSRSTKGPTLTMHENCLQTVRAKKLELSDHSQDLKNVTGASKLSFKIISKQIGQSNFDAPNWLGEVEEKDSQQVEVKAPKIALSKQIDPKNTKKPISRPPKKTMPAGANSLLKYHALSKKRFGDSEATENSKSLTPSANISKPNLNCNNSNMVVLDKGRNKEPDKYQPAKILSTSGDSKTFEADHKIREVHKKENNPRSMFEEHKNRPTVSPRHEKLHSSLTKGSKTLSKSQDIPNSHFSTNVSHTNPLISKSRIMMNLLTDVTKPQEVKKVSKRPATPIASKHTVKEQNGSRRDVLLKQLKAVEDAIARKKAKFD